MWSRLRTNTQILQSTYNQGLATNKSSTQLIQLNYKHVLDKYERIEYIDNTINIQTNTIIYNVTDRTGTT